jgi:hypothetical protein
MQQFLSKLLQSISALFETKGASEPQPDLSQIDEAAGEVDEQAPQRTVEERIAFLENQLEFLAEERGLENKYLEELSQYVSDLRTEAAFIQTARKVFGVLAILTAAGLLITPVVLAYTTSGLFYTLPDYPKSVLLIGMIAGGVLLIQGLTKAVYRSAHERQSDEFIPPQIKVIHDLMHGSH